MPAIHRYCRQCKRVKSITGFYPKRRVCKTCIGIYNQQNYQARKDNPIYQAQVKAAKARYHTPRPTKWQWLKDAVLAQPYRIGEVYNVDAPRCRHAAEAVRKFARESGFTTHVVIFKDLSQIIVHKYEWKKKG